MRTLVIILMTLGVVAVGMWAFWTFYLKKNLNRSSLLSDKEAYDPSSLVQTAWGGIVQGKQLIGSSLGNGLFVHNDTGAIYSLSNGKKI